MKKPKLKLIGQSIFSKWKLYNLTTKEGDLYHIHLERRKTTITRGTKMLGGYKFHQIVGKEKTKILGLFKRKRRKK